MPKKVKYKDMNYFLFPGLPNKIRKNYSLTVNGMFKRQEAESIIEMVASHFDISVDTIKNKSRRRGLVFPRQVAMWLILDKTKLSCNDTAILMGGRDHTTAIHARDTVNNLMDAYPETRAQVNSVLDKYENMSRSMNTIGT